MGGCIGLRTLLERADFGGAIFSAPMWHLQMKAATRELTAKMTRLANVVGLGARLMPGTRPEPTALAVAFEGNALTSDPEVFAWCVDQVTAHPELALGGPSMQWTYAALEEMARLYVAPLPSCRCWCCSAATRRGLDQRDPQPGRRRWRGRAPRAPRRPPRDLHGAPRRSSTAVWRRIDGFLAAVPARRDRSRRTGVTVRQLP